jgi:hypothetical protein
MERHISQVQRPHEANGTSHFLGSTAPQGDETPHSGDQDQPSFQAAGPKPPPPDAEFLVSLAEASAESGGGGICFG